MSQARVLGIVGLAALAVATVAYAQTTVTPIPDTEPVQTAPLTTEKVEVTWGDVQRGQTLAGTCAACHGLDGNPTDPQYPRLAGQSERYTAHQLALFKSGERNTGMAAVMMPFASALSAQDARDLGAYFATQEAGAGVADDGMIGEGPNAGMKFYQVGEKLFHAGDKDRGIPACMACHGPSGAGNPGPPYPQVAGQPAAYTQRRLEEYRAGTTSQSDPRLFKVMATVAHNLTDQEIGSLASYLEGLHPRSNDLAVVDTPPPATVQMGTAGVAPDTVLQDSGTAPTSSAVDTGIPGQVQAQDQVDAKGTLPADALVPDNDEG